jgi:hypothetical protein
MLVSIWYLRFCKVTVSLLCLNVRGVSKVQARIYMHARSLEMDFQRVERCLMNIVA